MNTHKVCIYSYLYTHTHKQLNVYRFCWLVAYMFSKNVFIVHNLFSLKQLFSRVYSFVLNNIYYYIWLVVNV